MSGWVIKWPLASQTHGFATKRYLVLRDNTLSYYKDSTYITASGLEAVKSNMVDCLFLTEYSYAVRARKRLRACIKVVTSTDTMWFR